MKKKLIIALCFIAVLGVGCILGAAVQYLKTGYSQKILKTESFPFPDGGVKLNYTFESVGMSFPESETSVLTVTQK